jgi:uncharacterized protein GlcG (DUF336 family)
MFRLLRKCAIATVFLASTCGSAFATDGDPSCPVSWNDLQTAISNPNVVEPGTGWPSGHPNHFWLVVVNRSGTVCAVAFSGKTATDQWLLSRQIAAAKAFTSNGLSLNSDVGGGQQWATAMLDGAVQTTQDKGGLFGVHFGNAQDPNDAYKGPSSKWGTSNDPLVGKRIGGTISFGGGVPLVDATGKVWGALGVSGDSACNDDRYARSVRSVLAGAKYKFGNDKASTCASN